MRLRWIGGLVIIGVLVAAPESGAQQVRSFTTPERRPEQKVTIPRAYLPPKGMCRIWIDSVPARQQPAPTDCATAIRNKPQNGQVIFSEENRDRDKDSGRKGKDKPKKPGE
jgi:hypothetical protein